MPQISDRQAITILREALCGLGTATLYGPERQPCFCGRPVDHPDFGDHVPACQIARAAWRMTDHYERKTDA